MVIKFYKISLFCLLSIPLSAQTRTLDIVVSDKAIIVNAQQTKLTQLLNTITETTGVIIHYATLPEQLFNLHCVSTTIVALMNCIFSQPVNMVIRYPAGDSTQTRQAMELWLLTIPTTKTIATIPKDNRTQFKTINNDNITALSNPDARIREQAVATLANKKDVETTHALQIALTDKEVSVRLMAVDSAGDNITLLQQARLDTDNTVRTYAINKLKALSAHY